jgi:hypothetical protein
VSYILNALRKQENERNALSPASFSRRPQHGRHSNAWRIFFASLAAVLLIMLAAGGGLWMGLKVHQQLAGKQEETSVVTPSLPDPVQPPAVKSAAGVAVTPSHTAVPVLQPPADRPRQVQASSGEAQSPAGSVVDTASSRWEMDLPPAPVVQAPEPVKQMNARVDLLPQQPVDQPAGKALQRLESRNKPENQPDAAMKQPVELKLTGILYNEQRPLAFINDKLVSVGDSVEGYRVISVSRNEVRLEGYPEVLQTED